VRSTLPVVMHSELRRLLRSGLGWVLFVAVPLLLPAVCILGAPLIFPDVSDATGIEGVISEDPNIEDRRKAQKLKRKLIPLQLPEALLSVVEEEDRIVQKEGGLPNEGPLTEDHPLAVVSVQGSEVVVTTRRDIIRSADAIRRLEPIVERASEQQMLTRLVAAGFSPEEALSVEITTIDRTEESERLGRSTGAYVPLLLFVLLLTGAMYSSVDLVTGEREHGTAETILSSPVDRRILMLGKGLVVLGMTELAMLLGLCSIAFLKLVPAAQSNQVVEGLDGGAFGVLLLLSAPLSAQIAGLTLCVASWAPTYRAFSIATVPLILGTTLAAALPTVQLIPMTPLISVLPLANLAMLSRELLAGTSTPGLTILAVCSAIAWSGGTLWLASRYLAREEAMVGGPPQKKESDVRRALTLWGIGLGMYWFFGQVAQVNNFALGLLFTQVVLIGGSALVALLFWNRPIFSSCSFTRPRVSHIMLTILVGVTLPALGTLAALAQAPFIPTSEASNQEFAELLLGNRPLLANLGLIALLPALCEEFFFRGALLGLLKGALSDRSRVILVAALFGIFHLSFNRILPTAVLGLALGLLVLWTGSLWTAVVAHFLNNALAVTIAHFELGNGDISLAWALAGSLACLGLLALIRKTRTTASAPPGP
jgi:sodium transport system permease protein